MCFIIPSFRCSWNMARLFTVSLCLAPLFFLSSGCAYTSISTRQHQVVFRYLDDHKSEKDLPICTESSACSVLHKRYWLPPIAERLCRCPSANECPWKWTNNPDNKTITLNNRAQLKFCTSLTSLETCSSKSTALVTTSTKSTPSKFASFNLQIHCYCPVDHHWRHSRTIKSQSTINSTRIQIEQFKCTLLKRCSTGDFCGNVRIDFMSVYYACSCPTNHYCVYKDKSVRNVEEILYKGPAYKAYCELNKDDDDY